MQTLMECLPWSIALGRDRLDVEVIVLPDRYLVFNLLHDGYELATWKMRRDKIWVRMDQNDSAVEFEGGGTLCVSAAVGAHIAQRFNLPSRRVIK